ncbi:hypothetical protein AOQ84DRAFT_293680, partial [Glonium stellatum]
IDTCCIDQKSSSELSESINSMFSWYRDAELCIAYLYATECLDLDQARQRDMRSRPFRLSGWFRRGWTLQELIAPRDVLFYQAQWKILGLRSTLASLLTEITHIPLSILTGCDLGHLSSYSIATRFSWAVSRSAARPEDRVYSLIGLFGVNIPTLYGEGESAAFYRLRIMIFQTFLDHTILSWHYQRGN